jgi:hypothetical protein
MKSASLDDLQNSVQDRFAFGKLDDYSLLCQSFLNVLQNEPPTRIVSPSHSNYIFFQYPQSYSHKITRPLNSDLFVENPDGFQKAFERFITFLSDLSKHKKSLAGQKPESVTRFRHRCF